MKFIFALLAIGIAVCAFVFLKQPSSSVSVVPNVTPEPTTINSEHKKTITINEETYGYAIIGPVKPTAISAISNIPEKASVTELMSAHSCTAITNGGFYTAKDTHIGLFVIDDVVKNPQVQNPTFNGLVWATKKGIGGIGTLLPDEPLNFALQTGPMLMEDSLPRELSLMKDEHARRIVVATTPSRELLFVTMFEPNNTFNGPLLKDLPLFLTALIEEETIEVDAAINLDGGNHSAFINDAVRLTELSPVGSVFCIQ